MGLQYQSTYLLNSKRTGGLVSHGTQRFIPTAFGSRVEYLHNCTKRLETSLFKRRCLKLGTQGANSRSVTVGGINRSILDTVPHRGFFRFFAFRLLFPRRCISHIEAGLRSTGKQTTAKRYRRRRQISICDFNRTVARLFRRMTFQRVRLGSQIRVSSTRFIESCERQRASHRQQRHIFIMARGRILDTNGGATTATIEYTSFRDSRLRLGGSPDSSEINVTTKDATGSRSETPEAHTCTDVPVRKLPFSATVAFYHIEPTDSTELTYIEPQLEHFSQVYFTDHRVDE